MQKWLAGALALLLLLMCHPALTEEEAAFVPPASLREAKSIEEAEYFLLYPPEDGTAPVQQGYIRYISQHRASDPSFRDAYWLGGPEDSALNLMRTMSVYSVPYYYHAGNMCTRAVYSMALSYLGIDMSPGEMSAVLNRRDMDPPYSEISALTGVELVQPKAYAFDTMLENYLSDPACSPVYLYLTRPNGQPHTLLVVAALEEKSQYLVVDPSAIWLHGEPHHVYMIALDKMRTKILHATFRDEYVGSTVLQVYQWRLAEQEEQIIQ